MTQEQRTPQEQATLDLVECLHQAKRLAGKIENRVGEEERLNGLDENLRQELLHALRLLEDVADRRDR
jgi:hypothetical protein